VTFLNRIEGTELPKSAKKERGKGQPVPGYKKKKDEVEKGKQRPFRFHRGEEERGQKRREKRRPSARWKQRDHDAGRNIPDRKRKKETKREEKGLTLLLKISSTRKKHRPDHQNLKKEGKGVVCPQEATAHIDDRPNIEHPPERAEKGRGEERPSLYLEKTP